jgi:dihydroorotase
MTFDLDLSRAWLVDPGRRKEGPAEVVVRGGILRSVRWLRGSEAAGIDDRGVVVSPPFVDLHAHFREPGNDAAETLASGMAAAAHGGFGTVCVMPNSDPAIDSAGAVAGFRARIASGKGREGATEVRVWGAVTVGRRGEQLAPLGELADADVIGFSDDGSPIRSATIFRNALSSTTLKTRR